MKAVLFDVDSTLVTIEGPDHLAAKKNVVEDVASITKLAMEGEIDFTKALVQRFALIKPTQADLVELGQAYIDNLTPGAKEAVDTLHNRGYHVWLISGGFQPAIGILAKSLGIPTRHIAANNMEFTPEGFFQRIKTRGLLARNGGKAKIAARLRRKYDYLAFIGDGVTDLETQPLVHRFIGFGGVVYREKVAKEAGMYIHRRDLTAILEHI